MEPPFKITQAYLLELPALPESRLHIMPLVSAVEVDKGEGERDVQVVGPLWGGCPFPGLKCDHQIHPGSWALHLEGLDEIFAEYLAQHFLKGEVNPNRSVWTPFKDRTWPKVRRSLYRELYLIPLD